MKIKHFLRTPSNHISFLIELPQSNWSNWWRQGETLDWISCIIEINKNILTSVRHLVGFPGISLFSYRIQLAHRLKRNTLHVTTQRLENVREKKFHTVRAAFLYPKYVSFLNPVLPLISFLGVFSNKCNYLQEEHLFGYVEQNKLCRDTPCLVRKGSLK